MSCECNSCVVNGSDCGCGPKPGANERVTAQPSCATGTCAITSQTRPGGAFGNDSNNWALRLRGNRPRGNWGSPLIIAGVSNNDSMMNGAAGMITGNEVPYPVIQPAEQGAPIPSVPAAHLLPSAQATMPVQSYRGTRQPEVANVFTQDFAPSNVPMFYGSGQTAPPGGVTVTPSTTASQKPPLTQSEDAARDEALRTALLGMGTQGIGALNTILTTFIVQGNETERARERARTERVLGQMQAQGALTPAQLMEAFAAANAAARQPLPQSPPPPPPPLPASGITPTHVAIGVGVVLVAGIGGYFLVKSMKKDDSSSHGRGSSSGAHGLPSGLTGSDPYGKAKANSTGAASRGSKHPGYTF